MAAVAENAVGAGDQLARLTLPSSQQRKGGGSSELEYQREVRELLDLLSKLNPSAKEFIPSSHASQPATADGRRQNGRLSADAPAFVASSDYYGRPIVGGNREAGSGDGPLNNQQPRRRRNNYNKGRQRVNEKVQKAQEEERIRRTVYVADIDHHVTEEQLAALFGSCGKIGDFGDGGVLRS